MKYKFQYFVVLTLISNLVLSQKLVWKENVKLNWNNFKAKEKKVFAKDSTVVSYSSCGLKYIAAKDKTNNKIKVKIDATFDENSSWKHPSKYKNISISHEQVHFDIAEIYARKLRREFLQNVKNDKDFELKFKIIYQMLYGQFLDEQNEYDNATKRGTLKDKQQEYEAKIKKELIALEAYKN